MPPLPSSLGDMTELQLRATQAEIANLRRDLGLTLEPASSSASSGGAAEDNETPVGDLSAELSRRLAGMSPSPAPKVARLRSYAAGEYGDALRSAAPAAVTFAADSHPALPATGLGSSLGRLKSYGAHEYGAALRAGTPTPPAGVTFARDSNPAPSAGGLGSSLGRLKSYGAEEYRGVLAEAEPEPEVSFATEAFGRTPGSGRIGRLKSYGAGEYAGVLGDDDSSGIRATAPAFITAQAQEFAPSQGLSKMQEVAVRRQKLLAQQAAEEAEWQMEAAWQKHQQQLARLHQQQKPSAPPAAAVRFADPERVAAAAAVANRFGRLQSYGSNEYAGVLKVPVNDGSTPLKSAHPKVVRTLTPHGINDMVETRLIPANDCSRRGSIGEEQARADEELASVMAETSALQHQMDAQIWDSVQGPGYTQEPVSTLRKRQPTPYYVQPGSRTFG